MTKEKNKFDFIQNEKLLCSKQTLDKVKRQDTGWEKIFANHKSDKGLTVYLEYKEHLHFNNKKAA